MNRRTWRIRTARTLAGVAALLLAAASHSGGSASARGLQGFVSGGGNYSIPSAGLDAQFGVVAVAVGDRATGLFRHRGLLQGLEIDFSGRVTCLSVDPINNRAWIGGVITKNRSTHQSFVTPRHQVGRDIWFRVVDYGSFHSTVPDRTTFVGFEGDAGFPTSQAYCDGMPWPDNDERTWEVVGFVKVED
jgi:hypothetical protein